MAGGTQADIVSVSVRYYNIVADLIGRREETRLLSAGTTARDLVQELARENPSFAALACTVPSGAGGAGDGQVSGHIRLFRNGQAVLDLDETLVQGDQLRLFPAISGG
jgi:molybdopterin converting factor small subunit